MLKRYSEEYAASYAALWAYGADTLRMGGTEGFYAAVSQTVAEGLDGRIPSRIVDVGCGVGRVVRDLATDMVGFEPASAMLNISKRLLQRGETIGVDLRSRGLPKVKIKGQRLTNVEFVSTEKQLLAICKPGSCDVVISSNVIDRVASVHAHVALLARLLAPRGCLVLATPCNWQTESNWDRFPSFNGLISYVERSCRVRAFKLITDLPYQEVLDGLGAVEAYRVGLYGGLRSGTL
jgi:SAM-dependent methyltransferase